MTRTTKLILLRIYVYCKWLVICLVVFALLKQFINVYVAHILAAWLTMESFLDPDNEREQQLFKPAVITLYKLKDR